MERVVVRSQISGIIHATSSKSYAQRALAAALLSEGTTELLNVDLCDDTQAAMLAIEALGAVVSRCDQNTYLITGGVKQGRLVPINIRDREETILSPLVSPCDQSTHPITGGVKQGRLVPINIRDKEETILSPLVSPCDQSTHPITGGVKQGRLVPPDNTINVGESALSARMFAPIVALCDAPITITGCGSLLTRPQGAVIDSLRALGVEVESNDGMLPLTMRGPITGSRVEIDGSISSQVVTGLLMALPLCESDTTLVVTSPTSLPYIDMTIGLLRDFGVEVAHTDYKEYYIEGGQSYSSRSYNIEGDWSSASCMLVAGAVAGEVTVTNLNTLSLQADVAIIDALSLAGAEVITTSTEVIVKRGELHGFDFDATHCPDLFPALVALAANCEGVTTLKGASRLANKESDRAAALQQEFGRMGIEIDLSGEDTMRVVGGTIVSATVESHGDHRIAMAVAVAALNSDDRVVIRGGDVVNKSYPDFWKHLESIMV